MVQPAHKRRMVEDESTSEFEDLENLEIAKASNKISNSDMDLASAVNEDNGELETSQQAENAATFGGLVTSEKDNPPLADSVMSPPPTFEDFVAEPPTTPKRQISMNQTTSTPRSVNVQRTVNDKSLRMESQKSPSPEEEVKPRMVMTRMVLHNFKSYAGRQDIGPFHKVSKASSCVMTSFHKFNL